MKGSFSTPQRQSLVGVVVMFTDTLQGTVRALWPLLLVSLLRINETNKLFVGLGVAAIILLVAAIAYLKYYNFTFFLDEDNEEFVIRKGILNKSRIAIPLDKIQQVNINQSIIQKFIAVHALEVDTAGSSKKEVTIKAITHDLAVALKERLLESERKSDTTVFEENYTENKEHAFIQISFLSLLKTGITSNYARSFALLFAFVITVYQNIEEYIDATGYNIDPIEEYINPAVLLKFVGFIILAIIVLTLLVNLSRTILKYFNYRITRQQNSLLLSYGLLTTHNTIIKPERVQMVSVGRNYFQKRMDIQDVKIRQASNLDSNSKEQRKLAIEIPGCNEKEKDVLLRFLLEKMPERGVMLKPNIRKVIFQVLKFLILPIGIFFFFANIRFSELYDYIIFLPLYFLFVVAMIYFAYRNSRLFVNNEFIIKQSGAWDIDNDFLAHVVYSCVC